MATTQCVIVVQVQVRVSFLQAVFVLCENVPSLLQAAWALGEMYKKQPVLYNSSMVCSFEPKVIYKVISFISLLDSFV